MVIGLPSDMKSMELLLTLKVQPSPNCLGSGTKGSTVDMHQVPKIFGDHVREWGTTQSVIESTVSHGIKK